MLRAASTGEEAVLLWELHRVGGRWLVQSVAGDGSADQPLPRAPHPRSSPDAVVAAQLRALASGDTWTVRLQGLGKSWLECHAMLNTCLVANDAGYVGLCRPDAWAVRCRFGFVLVSRASFTCRPETHC